MAITTKADLKTEVGEYLDNPPWFTSRADNLLVFAEARLNRMLKGRLAKTKTPLVGVVSSREIALPAAYSEALGLWRVTSVVREEMTAYLPETIPYSVSNGTPCAFAISGSNIILNCPCDAAHTFDFLYIAKFALAADADTNWLLTNWSSTYFEAVMVEAFKFKRDFEAASAWDSVLQASVDEINLLDSRADALAGLNFDPALITRRHFNIVTGS